MITLALLLAKGLSFFQPVTDYLLPHSITTQQEMSEGLLARGLSNTPSFWVAVEQFTKFLHKADNKEFDFHQHLLPHIYRWATDETQKPKLYRLKSSKTYSVLTLTAKQILYILANAFFLNDHQVESLVEDIPVGDMSFKRLYERQSSICIERILCQLCYFYRMSILDDSSPELQKKISFHRISFSSIIPSLHFPLNYDDLIQDDSPFAPSLVKVTTAAMEASSSPAFVDFANMKIHIHKIIPSMTQEEVLFSCCPEAFPSILFCETMKDDEIILIEGVRRFSDYTGYLDSFRWNGFYSHSSASSSLWETDLIVMDALCLVNEFIPQALDRELQKAFTAFASYKLMKQGALLTGPQTSHSSHSSSSSAASASESKQSSVTSSKLRISTGHWGCGVFGGTKVVKFVQQLIAAHWSGVELDYSTHKDEECKSNFDDLFQLIVEKKITTKDLYKAFQVYNKLRMDEHPGGRLTKNTNANFLPFLHSHLQEI